MKSRNLFWGLFFILAAVFIILKQSGYIVGIDLVSLIITILLIPIIIKSITRANYFGILIPTAILGIIYADFLGIQNFVPWPILGVAVFFSIGLHLMFPSKHHHCHEFCSEHMHEHHIKEDKEEGFAEIIDEPDENEVNVYNRFNGSVKYINSVNLKKVNLDCSFGAMKLYFDTAKLADKKAVVDVDINFSGVELYIPKEWKVENRLDNVLGGIEEKGYDRAEKDGNVLTLTGKTSFSGVSIFYI